MREMLFRAWHKKRKKYYKVLHLHFNDFEGNWVTCEGYDVIEQKNIHIQIQPNDFILEQYTGLKDKNGVKIFEGDRVLITGQGSIPDYEAIIYFELGRFAVKGKFCQDTSMIHFLSSETIEDFEIIGNIHEVEK